MLQQSDGAGEDAAWGGKLMILLIDNYDSFTFNLYQYIGTFTQEIRVVRNDGISYRRYFHGNRLPRKGGAVSFACRTARGFARMSDGDGRDGGRGNYGGTPQGISGSRTTVPSRIHLYGARKADGRELHFGCDLMSRMSDS